MQIAPSRPRPRARAGGCCGFGRVTTCLLAPILAASAFVALRSLSFASIDLSRLFARASVMNDGAGINAGIFTGGALDGILAAEGNRVVPAQAAPGALAALQKEVSGQHARLAALILEIKSLREDAQAASLHAASRDAAPGPSVTAGAESNAGAVRTTSDAATVADAERFRRAIAPPAVPSRFHVVVPDEDLAFMAPELRPLRNWTVALHARDSDFVSDEAARGNAFEPHVMARISSALGGPVRLPNARGSPGNARKVFLDVGANIGYHTLFALALGHEVIAVEPFGRNIGLIRASVAANEAAGFGARLTLHKRALTDRDESSDALCILSTQQLINQGNARIVVLREPATQAELLSGSCSGRWLRSGADERWAEHDAGAGEAGAGAFQIGERVESARLDALVPRGVFIHAAKADVEGYEALALRGAAATFAENAPCAVIFEYNNCQVIQQSGVDCNAMLRDFVLQGYRLFELGSAVDITPARLGPADPPMVTLPDGTVVERKWAEYEMRLLAPGARQRCADLYVPRHWKSGELTGEAAPSFPPPTIHSMIG